MCESELMSSIYSNYGVNTSFSIPKTGFRAGNRSYTSVLPKADGYVSSPFLDKFGTASDIERTAKNNPRIREIMNNHNLPIKVNAKELEALKNGHLQDTRIMAAKIYSNLPSNLKNEINLQELQEAAMFHDYGKVLIPEHILNKNGQLSQSEWAVMREHSELGAELLRNKNISPRAAELVKYHHQNKTGNGYPAINNSYEYGIDYEILSAADKYDALTKKRSYKEALPKVEALGIIENDVKSGLISEEVFNALKKSV